MSHDPPNDPDQEEKRRPDTQVLTRGFDPRLSVGSARPAVFRSSTYVFRSPEAAERAFQVALGKVEPAAGESVDLIYSRLSHPNAEILEDQIVPLEPRAKGTVVFNSGMAAISTLLLARCRPGDAVLFTEPLYGGTHLLLHDLMTRYDVRPVPVPAGNTQAITHAIESLDGLRIVLIETPANPTLRMTDIRAAADAVSERSDRPIMAVDNTFMGPTFQHPLEHGADCVIYSATKYLSGFSDMLGGVITARDEDILRELRAQRATLGNILQPDECWLLDSRLATVSLRMHQQSENAQRIVEALGKHERVMNILFPKRFEDGDQRAIFGKQCSGPGAIFSVELAGGRRAAFDFLRRLRITRNAVSLGGMESLACHPATTTHSEIGPEEQRAIGITEGMVRISVGLEDWQDLLQDFEHALDAL
jgi:cystathionine beta-lyase/cystathionine gamma-synthase